MSVCSSLNKARRAVRQVGVFEMNMLGDWCCHSVSSSPDSIWPPFVPEKPTRPPLSRCPSARGFSSPARPCPWRRSSGNTIFASGSLRIMRTSFLRSMDGDKLCPATCSSTRSDRRSRSAESSSRHRRSAHLVRERGRHILRALGEDQDGCAVVGDLVWLLLAHGGLARPAKVHATLCTVPNRRCGRGRLSHRSSSDGRRNNQLDD